MTFRSARGRDKAVFAALLVANLAMLYWPSVQGPGGVPHLDKAGHLASFAALAWAGWRLYPRHWLAVVLLLHAAVSEFVQHLLVPGRSGDPGDLAADVIGVAIGIFGGRVLGGTWAHERAGDDGRSGRTAARRQPGAG